MPSLAHPKTCCYHPKKPQKNQQFALQGRRTALWPADHDGLHMADSAIVITASSPGLAPASISIPVSSDSHTIDDGGCRPIRPWGSRSQSSDRHAAGVPSLHNQAYPPAQFLTTTRTHELALARVCLQARVDFSTVCLRRGVSGSMQATV